MKNLVIETIAISKIYEGVVPVKAVDAVDLQIEDNEFTAIVGPSGSGKTTLLNMIGGLDRPTSGSVKVNGRDLTGLSENQLIDFRLNHIGFVFQSYNLIPVLNAKENTEFIMLLQNIEKKVRDERVEKLLNEVGLGDKMKSKPSQLSGGQQQRVAVARALASKPDFVLADEPTANLDSHSTSNLLDIMARLNEEEGTTFVFSTHDQRVIDRAKRVITLVDGKIESDIRK
ncbi:MAG TPA: macrolide ABC transporter ATP-binding protein [Flavobacteriales bacterium]|jgi:putative ABC transport system ATP-binding protein|nr:macrolide ABC transporter ATP-binding protein [Flavobacteriales bacterium]HAQ71813.1 macrolide ABC transporter ATP-binding protein [Flavobacteriales bacterium]